MLALLVFALAEFEAPRIATPVEARAPVYTDVAVKAKATGVVEVEETIEPDGRVSQAVAVKSPNPILGVASVDAAREWRFDAVSSAERRKYVIRFEFSVDSDAPWPGDCYFSSPIVTFNLPSQTVRIRGRYRPPARSPTP